MPTLNLSSREYRTLKTVLSRTSRTSRTSRVTAARYGALEKMAKQFRRGKVSPGVKEMQQLEKVANDAAAYKYGGIGKPVDVSEDVGDLISFFWLAMDEFIGEEQWDDLDWGERADLFEELVDEHI